MRNKLRISVVPYYIFQLLFVLGPLLYVVFLSFTTRTDSWDIDMTLTWENYKEMFRPVYLPALKQSLQVAAVSTAVCVALGYPAGLSIAKMEEKYQRFFLGANLLPFLFNSMMRICGLMILMRSGGLLDRISGGRLNLLYSFPAVVIGMVYVLLPMMIYSVYSAAARINGEHLEAARISGATPFRAFLDVTLPLTAGGLLNGVVLCFIPAMGLYIVSTLLGGGKTVLISNIIEDQLMKVHNLPFTAALSVVLVALTAAMVALARLLDPVQRKRRAARRSSREAVR